MESGVTREIRCADCRTAPPSKETNYSLIKRGWRVIRAQAGAAPKASQWRCPACWTRFKQANADDPLARSGEQSPGDTGEFTETLPSVRPKV